MDGKQEPEEILPDFEAVGLNEREPGESRASQAGIPVVGIGASAGGLEVFKHLLGDLPGDTGLAIVFVQHLDPSHHSMLAEILARATVMTVREAANGMPVEANHVYVIPANVDLAIASGTLKLTPRAPGSHMPIDGFLRSLANQCESTAIAVILSGTGSDGAAGVEAIKDAGGVTFAQDAATAKFPAMPMAAAATGCVDFVLTPDRIAAELGRLGRYIVDRQRAQLDGGPATGEESFNSILSILHGATGVDFSLYREKMVKRRILRRLALHNIGSVAEYSKRLENDSAELMALQRDMFISVTSFFRDRESFESLKRTVFPRIFQERSGHQPIRVWVTGCATGEEAFSIAILLQEFMNETGAGLPVKIFASDISLPAIEKARRGRYLESIAADLTQERLNRCFAKIDGGYEINKSLRDMCIFTRHNLIEDPPFSKLDFISCRNALIYLGSVRKNIIPVFHYALKPHGFLMLGAAEAMPSGDLFSVVDRKHRIYAKREAARKPRVFRMDAHGSDKLLPAIGSSATPQLWSGGEMRKEVDRILVSKYSAAGLVVDEDWEVLEIRGKAGPYLTLPAGRVSFHLMRLIPDTGLFLEVEKLIRRVRKSGEQALQKNILYEQAESSGALNLEVVPLESSQKRWLLVLFEPVPAGGGHEIALTGAPPEGDTRDRRIARLKQQLRESKERFLSDIEMHRAATDESQIATEEALSTNEELQSLNEELETAKEELQATNEELITVNDELQAKNSALAEARDLAMSIVETVPRPLLVLDMNLQIRMANRAFYRTFQTSLQETEGQLIYALASGSWDLPGLRDLMDGLLQRGSSFADYEVQQDFPRVGHRSLVLGGCFMNHLSAILLAVDDITERKLAQQALHRSEEHLRQSQKMEAVGRLAGGIAHDFNNLLTSIIGYSTLLYEGLAGNEPVLQQVLEIKAAGERAAALTQQLLAFSRRQVLQPKVLDLNAIVADFDRMLYTMAGERIKVAVTCDSALWRVRADPGEIGRVLMNLSLNTRDAMPEGGTLTIETSNVTVTEADAESQELTPGRYVMMAVHDTGVGMDAEVCAHIFEPFFTTKATGKGTGLGLATVLGIVEQSGGTIFCESKPGNGTTFKIFLPAVAEAVEQESNLAGSLTLAPQGTEIVLLVEDEEAVRKLARVILEASGYLVLEARNGREGLALCQAHQGSIDLLLTDVMMPEINGRELAEGACKQRPALKVLFMSGHTEDVVLKEGIRKGASFLQKPFTPLGLAQKVRDALDMRTDSAAG